MDWITFQKILFYIFNCIFPICGVFMIIYGAIMLSGSGNFKFFNDETISISFIILGCIILPISSIGFYGVFKENIVYIILFGVCTFILCCLQVLLCVWVFLKRSDFLTTIDNLVATAFNENDDSHGYPMVALELAFNCCGIRSFWDYVNIQAEVPKSCCGYANTDDAVCEISEYRYKDGCGTVVSDFWLDNMGIINYCNIFTALTELNAVVFACYLINSIRKAAKKPIRIKFVRNLD